MVSDIDTPTMLVHCGTGCNVLGSLVVREEVSRCVDIAVELEYSGYRGRVLCMQYHSTLQYPFCFFCAK